MTWAGILHRGGSLPLPHVLARGTAIEEYLHDIGGVGLLDADEERRLGAEIAGGGIEARNRLIVGNLRLVIWVAKKYRTPRLDFADLVQAGTVGLLKTIERFDPKRGVKLGTYATWGIRNAVRRARRAEMKHLARRDDGDVLKTIPDDRAGMPEDSLFGEIDREQVRRLLDGIGQRAATVLRLAYGVGGEGPLARAEIAGRLGVTAERVRQIEQRALRRMKKLLGG